MELKSKLKIIFIILIGVLTIPVDTYATEIYTNNFRLEDKSQEVMIIDNSTYITLTDVGKITGSKVSWDEKTSTATIKNPNNEIIFTSNSKDILWNNQRTQISKPALMNNGKLIVPSNVISSYYNYKLKWIPEKKQLLVNSDITKLNSKNEYKQEEMLSIIKEKVGEEIYNTLRFNYAGNEEIKDEKYLNDGKYFVFKSSVRGYHNKIVDGYFYYNIYTDELYFYSLNETHDLPIAKKFAKGGEIISVAENTGGSFNPLVATEKLLEKVNGTNSLDGYKFIYVDNIDEKMSSHLPKDGEYYYFLAYTVDDNENKKVQFSLGQDMHTLDVYMLLKDNDKINVVVIK